VNLRPRSLFSRLVLVMLAGLVTAQFLSFAIHMHERGELLLEASGMQSAQRVADIVKLLDTLGPNERRRIAGILSAPPMTVTLDQKPLALIPQDADRQARSALFGAFLRRLLGDSWPTEVSVTQIGRMAPPAMPNAAGPSMMRHNGSHGMRSPFAMQIFSQPALSFVAQVRLRDGTFVTFDTRQPLETANWPFRMVLSLAVLLAAVIAVTLIAVRWTTRPLAMLADAAEELGKNINRPPLKESGPVEVVRAARAFNTMQRLLVRYLQDRTRILAAMSHDLKTPITRLRLRAELLDDTRLREQFTDDLGEMESMVKATLDFMRGIDAGEPACRVDMKALLESLQSNLQVTGAQVSMEGSPLKPYWGKPQALKRCLMNLLENAVKYGKSARIVVSDSNAELDIRILDEGPGIPEQELERVFAPYYRLERSRNRETGGTGLGLTIARGIAEAHGGKLLLANRREGGLEAHLVLPRSPD